MFIKDTVMFVRAVRSLLLFALPLSGVVYAAPDDSEKIQQATATALDDLVVVATRHPRQAGEVAGSINSLNQTELQSLQVFSYADLVRELPGVELDQGGTRFGAGGIRIRGIGGNRVLTLVDGVPLADRFSVGSYGDTGRDYLDLGFVRQIEILRGPASVLYGSRALGGVVAMETLAPRDVVPFMGEADVGWGTTGGYRSDTREFWLAAQAAYVSEQWDALLAAGLREGEAPRPAQVPDSDKLDQQHKQRRSLLAKQVWHLPAVSGSAELLLDIEEQDRNTDIRAVLGTGRFRNTTAMLADDDQHRYRLALRYQGWWQDNLRVAARLYAQHTSLFQSTDEWRLGADDPVRQQRDFRFRQRVAGLGVDVQQQGWWGDDWQHLSGWGGEFQYGQLTQLRDAQETRLVTGVQSDVLLGEQFPLRDFPITHTRDVGLYWHSEITQSGSSFTWLPGIRFDRYELASQSDALLGNGNPSLSIVDLSHERLSAHAGFRWRASQAWALALRYREGFRSPPPMDVNLALFVPAFNYESIPNPDLKPEHSQGIEATLLYEQEGAAFEFTVHETRYRDLIQSRTPVGRNPDTGTTQFQAVNIDKARIRGVEVMLEQELGLWCKCLSSWHFNGNIAWLDGENVVNGQPLNDVPPARARFAVSWQPIDNPWSFRAVSTLVDAVGPLDETRQAQFKPAGYGLYDALVEYRGLGSGFVVRLGVYNVFDRLYHVASAVSGYAPEDPLLPYLAAPGRSFVLSWQGEF